MGIQTSGISSKSGSPFWLGEFGTQPLITPQGSRFCNGSSYRQVPTRSKLYPGWERLRVSRRSIHGLNRVITVKLLIYILASGSTYTLKVSLTIRSDRREPSGKAFISQHEAEIISRQTFNNHDKKFLRFSVCRCRILH